MTALASFLREGQSRTLLQRLTVAIGGALAITLAAQVSIHLPSTPVPVTMQTLAVAVLALTLGRKRAVDAVVAYLVAGACGAPVFADFSSLAAFWGPTTGYLMAFIPGAALGGWLRDRGVASTLGGSMLASFAVQTTILLVGASVFAAFLGFEAVWTLGVAPFLLGDVVKSIAGGIVAWTVNRRA